VTVDLTSFPAKKYLYLKKKQSCVLVGLLMGAVSCGERGGVSHEPAVVLPIANQITPTESAPAADQAGIVDGDALLSRFCIDCHGSTNQKGDVRFDTLGSLDADDVLDLIGRANEALHFQEMPPQGKPQPSAKEREQLLVWLGEQMGAMAGDRVKDKLRYPPYGNMVDHDQLFSGKIKDHAYTPARRWLISPQIFQQRVFEAMQMEDRDRSYYETRSLYGVTNPFVLPDHSGVRDYDISQLDGGHLLVMLNNAQWIADKQVFAAKHFGEDWKKLEYENPKDKWYPRKFAPESFTAILKGSGSPTDKELAAAIQTQFGLVLKREASNAELAKYLKLTRSLVQIGGAEQGLRQMCVAVLLESEFLYRIEFGGGKVDAFGRQMLTPREAAFAISYALGDRGPDAQLLKAAGEGRLQTKADYEREVVRLLADENYYRAQVDPAVSDGSMDSHVSSHPKLVRFFREFFGYTSAPKVFKDPPRSGGFYVNPGRGDSGSGGVLVNEADELVDYYVEKDQHVFESLLLGEEYFVAPYKHGEEAAVERVAALIRIYDRFKDTDWEKDFEQIAKENEKWLAGQFYDARGGKAFKGIMTHVKLFREKGLGVNPVYNYPFGTRMLTPWAKSYNIDPAQTDYVIDQPFKVEHRKGILTHPAWLVAHSTNFHSDPIRRGRWIREKLLAGRVPDVPITVNAQVPEDAPKTFRQRVEEVTAPDECWKCHKHMNPLGMPFESFDDFGRFRTEEKLEHPDNLIKAGDGKTTEDVYPTAPVNTAGALEGTGDSLLDSEVKDAFELIDRLAKSDRVRQSIIRHAFRFYMGRNEMLSDSQTLIDADRAYVESGGSFKAVVVSLLTSDSFMYRKQVSE